MAEKKYYWLKLKRDFFKRHDIQIIEAMPNGKDYVLFYLKLLCESVDHEGYLRFSENIPYNEDMLATITHTNIDIVRSAVKIFSELEMMEVMDDDTLYMTEVEKMIGSASQDEHTRESTRIRVQAFRERQKQALLDESVTVTLPVTESKSIEIEKEIDTELEIESRGKRFKPPTLEEVKAYCIERNNGIDPERFIDFYESKGWMVGKNKMKDWKAAVRSWESRNKKKDKFDYIDSWEKQ